MFKPSQPLSFSKTVFYYDRGNDTALLGSSISTWGGEIHWGYTDVSGSAAGVNQSMRYLVCLNCHFLTTNPAEAGLMKMVQGRTLIAVPEFAMELHPHTISDEALKEAASDGGSLVTVNPEYLEISSGLMTGMGIAGLRVWRKKN
jgi:hypothetical protein